MTDDNDKPASRSLPRETTEGAEAQAVGKTKVKRKPTGKGSS
jgi:hypothetical protein